MVLSVTESSALPASQYCDGCGGRLVETASLVAGRCEICRMLVSELERERDELRAEHDNLRTRFESACGLLERMQAYLDQTGLVGLGERYVDTVLPRLIAEHTELRAENERLRARLIELTNEGWYSQVQRLEDEVERLRADLGIYGDHLASCWLKQSPRVEVVGRSRCNCGYFEAVGKGLE